MFTRVEKTENAKDCLYEEAGKLIKSGELVAFPTETVYGLGGDALNAKAAMKIYQAKGRPSDNPLIVHIADMDALEKIAEDISDKAYALAERFWPGPLTMIFKKSSVVPYSTTGGLDTVAVRMPNHMAALKLIRYSGGYIAAPSANTSGRPSPTMASHVYEDLQGKIPLILDGGTVGIGIESTILDMSVDVPMILRPGYINEKMLQTVIGEVIMDPGLEGQDKNIHPKAPGMKYRHYAPKANLIIVEGTQAQVVQYINNQVKTEQSKGKQIGIIATDETAEKYTGGLIKIIGCRIDPLSISRHLYQILREFDGDGVECIYSESFQDNDMGNAIMNRLIKAAGHHIIKL